jgi:hypothetical protein
MVTSQHISCSDFLQAGAVFLSSDGVPLRRASRRKGQRVRRFLASCRSVAGASGASFPRELQVGDRAAGAWLDGRL